MTMKWHQRTWAPWVFFAGVFLFGLIGFMAIALVSALTGSTEAGSPGITTMIVWFLLGFLVTPASLAVSIVWALKIRRPKDPSQVAAVRAASAEQARLEDDRRWAKRQQQLSDKAANKEARAFHAAQQQSAKREAADARKQQRDADRLRRAQVRAAKPAPKSAPKASPRFTSSAAIGMVQVAYLDGLTVKNPWQTYTFIWALPQPPKIGAYVFVPGGAMTQVMAIGPGDYDGPLKAVARLATSKEVARAQRAGGVRFY